MFQDDIVRLCIGLRPLYGPFALVRTDPALGFLALAKDTVLPQYRVAIKVGDAKNTNKNTVAGKAIQEIQGKILRLEPHYGIVTPLLLALAVAWLNSRIQSCGMSTWEMLLQREQFSLEQLLVHAQRLANHIHNVKAKAPLSRVHLALIFALVTLCVCIVTVTSHRLEADILLLVQMGGGAKYLSL